MFVRIGELGVYPCFDEWRVLPFNWFERNCLLTDAFKEFFCQGALLFAERALIDNSLL